MVMGQGCSELPRETALGLIGESPQDPLAVQAGGGGLCEGGGGDAPGVRWSVAEEARIKELCGIWDLKGHTRGGGKGEGES